MWEIAKISPTVRPFEDQIRKSLDAVRGRIAELHNVKPIIFELKADRTRTLEIYGYGGFCCDPQLIRLSFDPKNPNMVKSLGQALEQTVAHEYHHALRAAGPGYGAKLGSALAAEGMAGQFVRQVYDAPPEPWEKALSADELHPYRQDAYDNFNARNHGHAKWFFGTGEKPRWLGYTLGYDMVARYLEDHNEKSALDLASTPYGEFRDYLITKN